MAKHYLPQEILQQIFIRMPTKPLVRLKCLSKQWNRTISDPLFMKSRSRRMIFLSDIPSDAIQNAFHAIDNTDDPSMIKLRFPFENLESKLDIIIGGSIDGIILLVIKTSDMFSHYHQLMLYNPLSGEFKMISNPTCSSSKFYAYGFGYATNTDDLKIVRIKSSSYEVFNLKDGSWSGRLESIGDYYVFRILGKFVNGFLYWFAEKKTHPHGIVILVLDIKKMVFSHIENPNGHWSERFDIYNGRLCIIGHHTHEEGCGLWVLNEHGFEKTWSMVCCFKSVFIINVLCVLDDGKLLMLKDDSNQLVIYDMFKDSYKEVNALTSFGQGKRLDTFKYFAIKYVESSISPSDICSSSSLPWHK